MSRRPDTFRLFPYTTLFRSRELVLEEETGGDGRGGAAGDDGDVHAELQPVHRGRRFRFRQSGIRSEEHTSELQSRQYLVCRPLLEKKNIIRNRQQKQQPLVI